MIPILENAHQLPLTDVEKEILAYCEKNPKKIPYYTLNALSGKLYASNASIVRFCQKLGLKGFNEFKYTVRSELEQSNIALLSSNSIINHSLALFKDNLEAIEVEKLKLITDLLTSNHPIYLCGSNLSSLPGKYLFHILTALDYPCVFMAWPELLSGLVHDLDEDAILFIIATHTDSNNYISALRAAHEKGIATVLLTNEADSQLIPYSSIWMVSNDGDMEYHHLDINPRIGILTIIQILIELVALEKNHTNISFKDLDGAKLI